MPIFSHYGDIPDISWKLSIPALVFSIATPLFVIARLISRQSFGGKIGADDWTIVGAVLLSETVCVQMIIVCEWAFGKHIHQVEPAIVAKTLKLYYFAQFLYKANVGVTKTSILLLYLRIFVQRWFRITTICIMAVVIAFTIASVMASIFQCSPIEFAFDKKLPGGGKCINLTILWFFGAGFNILSDFVIIALPIPVIRSLQLPTRSKVALGGVLSLGLFVCLTSILRTTTLDLATAGNDTTWNSIDSSIWTVIEENLGIICASMPALKRPIQHFFPMILGRVKGTVTGKRTRTSTTNASTWNDVKGEQFSMRNVSRPRESQDDILAEDRGEIMKTMEYKVEYDQTNVQDLRHADSDSFEHHAR